MKLSTIQRKRNRVRNKIKKVSKNDRFRLSVSRSTKNISAQIIDDKKQEYVGILKEYSANYILLFEKQ